MDVIKLWLFIIIPDMPVCTKLGFRGEDPRAGQEPVYEIGVKGYF